VHNITSSSTREEKRKKLPVILLASTIKGEMTKKQVSKTKRRVLV
jgi:hypothetical protein